jgi:DUF1009 family protein
VPFEVAVAARRSGRSVSVVGIEGFVGSWIADFPHRVVSIGQVGRMLATWRMAGCRDLVIAGAMRRPNLLQVRFDLGFFRAIRTALRLTRGGDDSILRRVITFFEREGFRVLGPHEVAPHLLAGAGSLGGREPTGAEWRAIARASAAIADLGRFDVGQAAVASADRLVVMESVRGTDAMLRLLAAEGARSDEVRVLVKLPKPGQELRIDLPTIGPETVRNAHASGISGIAIASGQSLVIARDEMINDADHAGLFLLGLPPMRTDGSAAADVRPITIRHRDGRRPREPELKDVAIGRAVLAAARRHASRQGVVVAGEHVQAINAGLPLLVCLKGLGRSSHWGLRVFRRRIGGLIADADALVDVNSDALADGIAEAGLAGLAIEGDAARISRDLARAAAARGLFVLTLTPEAAP